MARTNVPKRSLRFPIDTRNRDKLHTKLKEHDTALDALEAGTGLGNDTIAGIKMGNVADAAVSPAIASSGALIVIPILLPDAATTTYVYVAEDKMEIIDVEIIKDGAGAGNTIQMTDGADAAISNAIAAAVDKTVTRAGTLDKATRVLAAGATFKLVNTRSAGSSAAAVFIYAIKRA